MPDQVASSSPEPSTERASDAFNRLAPFIQEFIWKHDWSELREIQVRAAAAAFDTDRHLLLASGTASGKTEAALLPILTQLYEDPSSTVGALYIGPLKALINDQFLRLGDLCVEAEIAVTAWHGDVSASRKHALLKKPSGILQITPEALEGLLLNRGAELMRLFGDLRWIVIDEVHAFMASDRGGQVLALLDRLARYALDPTRLPRRIGLSATLGDYAEAAGWLDGVSRRGVEVIAETGGRTVFLLVDHFMVKPERTVMHELTFGESTLQSGASANDALAGSGTADNGFAIADKLITRQADLFHAAFEATQKRKSLIFTNTRGDAEEIITGLRRLAEREHAPDIYFVHHGSIAAALREAAESAMRDSEEPACTAATVTLELGIDLGQLDRVLQLGPTFSVASFLQRLGRTGRRGQRAEMFFLLRETDDDTVASSLEQIPWELLQAIAVIQLYAEERWIEPLSRAHLPGSLLYHQTMSIVGAAGELTPPQLAERVLTLAPFAHILQDDFRALLRHLLEIDHLERTETGGLILGLAGEKVVRNFRFLATFQDTTEWAVKDGTRDVGTIASPVPPGERFALAGRTWEVVDVVAEQRVLVVRHVMGGLKTHFTGAAGPSIHDRIVERMRRVLHEDTVYPYLTERAAARLGTARHFARTLGITSGPTLLPLGGDKLALLPWSGTKIIRTLAFRIMQTGDLTVARNNFYLTLTAAPGTSATAVNSLMGSAAEPWNATQIAERMERTFCTVAKYDEFLPDELLRKSFGAEQLDVVGARTRLRGALGLTAEISPANDVREVGGV